MDSTSQDSLQELSPLENLSICLPHPYLTRYVVKSIPRDLIATAPEKLPIKANGTAFRLFLAATHEQNRNFQEPKFPLHSPFLSFDSLTRGNEISVTDNTQWARARRSPSFTCTWISAQAPSIGQIWLVVYFLFTAHFDEEAIRLFLCGSHTAVVREELITLGLAVAHPLPCRETSMHDTWTSLSDQEIVLLRSAFWQGAASPFGTHSAWTPVAPPRHNDRIALEKFPAPPPTQTITTKFPAIRVHTSHPVRPAKPSPGTLFYSRYIPHLNEQYSMIALDYKNPEHLELFHTWQNDPRIAAGWNETGTLEQHRTYLKNLHNDAHIVTVLACFEDIPFAYFEIYWAKEDHLGTYYAAGDFDRGRHSLVGNAFFRGPHRTKAWWSSLMHYMFLDDVRTDRIVGEPKWSNTRVHELDIEHGFHIEKWIDLPHKRSALMSCSREKFFGSCTVGVPWVESKERKITMKL